jgi:multimeric flavodoxin WrbA
MKTLLIVFHSLTGGTRQMAEAARTGATSLAASSRNEQDGGSHRARSLDVACEPAIQVRMVAAPDAGATDLLAADGYIFATPENLAAMAGRMKDFFDRSYYPVLDRINGRPYAALICAGSDGENAARQIARIATGWRLRAVAAPLIICTKAQTPEAILAAKTIAPADLERCRDLGAVLAAGLDAGIF